MKKLIYLLPLILFNCTPSKTGQILKIDIYCDSCHVKVTNSNANFTETDYDGDVAVYKSIPIDRLNGESCVKISQLINYDTTSIDIYYIENSDTIAHAIGANGYCY